MTRDELNAEFRLLLAHYPGPIPQRLVDDLLAAAYAYAATQIEKACRTPVSQRGITGRQQEGERRSA